MATTSAAGAAILGTLNDFTSRENWDKFFALRGHGDSFEWYAEWPQIQAPLLSLLLGEEQAEILVPGCGSSVLSERLYDLGFRRITNVDFSRVLVADMLRRHASAHPEMRWRFMDMTRMQFPDGSFDAILDKGGLDALLEPEVGTELGMKYLNEAKRVLKSGGKFVCFTLAESHVLALLLSAFRFGWDMSIQAIASEPSNKSAFQTFMVVMVKGKMGVINTIKSLLDQSTEFCNMKQANAVIHALQNENRIRESYSSGVDILFSLRDLQLGAIGDLNVIVPGRRRQLILGEQGSSLYCYKAVLMDAKNQTVTFEYHCGVFIVPKARAQEWLFASEEGQWHVVESAKAARLIMVFLDSRHANADMDVIKKDLSPLVKDLEPEYPEEKAPMLFMMAGDGVKQRDILQETEHKGYADALLKLLEVLGQNKSEDHLHAYKIVQEISVQDISGVEGFYLLQHHIVLSNLFTSAVSFQRIWRTEVLSFVLDPLSTIWTQSEWETNLKDFFCSHEFRKSVSDIVVFFENELKLHLTEERSEVDKNGIISYATLTTLLPLILAHLLKLLQYVHALWTRSDLSEELEGAKCMMVFSEDLEESAELLDIDDEEREENEIREWLEQTRRSGYNVIGMCAQLKGVLYGFFDSSAVCGALMKDLNSMEFRHVSLIIKYTVIPLVKCCPAKLWTEWMDGLLDPVFDYFHYPLCRSWRKLLYENTVQVPDEMDYISDSKEKAVGMDLLTKLTRAASDLLAVIASPELNDGLENFHMICKTTSSRLDFICSKSLVGYVLYHDGLRLPILSLVSYIFGEWKDDKAKITSVPFCHKIIQLATATQSDTLVSFVQDYIIPHVIRCLTLESSLDRNTLSDLCREAYHCIQNQDLSEEEKHCRSTEQIFRTWLTKQMEVVRYRNTPFHELEEFIWTWEIEEEFAGYIPAYIDMLYQVHEMDDCLEWDSSSRGALLQKLKPAFVSKYAIDSASHDYIWTMSDILSRKISLKHWQRQHDQMYSLFCELIDFKPYIQHSSYDESVVEFLVENSEVFPGLAIFDRESALQAFCAILSLWEPQFHPLIRKGHKDLLTEIVYHLTYLEYISFLQPLQPDLGDFPVHLRAYAENYLDIKNKRYHEAKEQARLHEEFDTYLASGALDHCNCKGDAVKVVLDDSVPSQFSDLDRTLINLSIERRAKLLNRRDQLCSYSQYLKHVADNEKLRNGLQTLMYELEHEDFFSIDDESIDWDKKRFSELVEKFGNEVFAGIDLPKFYVIRGIMDYRAMSLMTDGSCSWDHAFAVVVGEPCHRWMQNLRQFWMETRYYKHDYYDIIQQPLQEVRYLLWV